MCLPVAAPSPSVVDHVPPEAVAFAVATSVPPSRMCTTTSPSSLAVPANDGVLSFDARRRRE